MAHSSPEPQSQKTQENVKSPEQFLTEIQQAIDSNTILTADKLRDELMNAHPTALSEILKTASIIEEAKTANLDQDHLATWKDLYQNLTEEEVNCLFYSLKKIVVPPKKRILAHGAYNSKLFFIDKGTVTVFITKDEKNKVIAQLNRGDLLGEYTFTTISLCSASVVSTSEVELRYIDATVAESWSDEYPALYDKVVQFCKNYGKVDEIIRKKELEKRTHPRYEVKGNLLATILNKEGKKTSSTIRGSLSNVSEVGCCFDIHCSKRETAKTLLARNCHLAFQAGNPDKPTTFQAVGKIVKVSFHLHSDYSVHIKFLKPVANATLLPIIPK